MLIVKIGGSVFAPKNKNIFDDKYLKKLNRVLLEKFVGRIILLHGTGSFGHNFVLNYGISKETFGDFLKYRSHFFGKIDKIFKTYTRIPGEKILDKNLDINRVRGNIISGGDAFVDTYEVLGSDDLFSKLISFNEENKNIILTDVDGVFDKNNKLINTLSLKNIDSINFWNKDGDVTNSMKGKILSLKKGLLDEKSGVWICNGFNLDNFEQILKTEKGVGTYITL